MGETFQQHIRHIRFLKLLGDFLVGGRETTVSFFVFRHAQCNFGAYPRRQFVAWRIFQQ